jgi:hypothetical protein
MSDPTQHPHTVSANAEPDPVMATTTIRFLGPDGPVGYISLEAPLEMHLNGLLSVLGDTARAKGRAERQQAAESERADRAERRVERMLAAGRDEDGPGTVPPAPPQHESLTILPGGFRYAGRRHDLTGRPLDMLRALLESTDGSLTADELRVKMRVSDESVDYPEQVVRDTARRLRRALRRACAAAGRPCADPLPSTGRRDDLTYRLAMP